MGTTLLKTCGTINAPGSYTLASDLVGSSSCLLISNVAGVHLDCGGHTSSGISLNNVTTATITNCVVSAQANLGSVTSVTITQSTFNNGISISKGQSVIVSDSTITSTATSSVFSQDGNDVEFLRDVVSNTGSGATIAAGLDFAGGSNNHVEQTTITSGYNDGPLFVGADDGIILLGETGDTIRGNSISAFFDSGVESLGRLADTTIIDNTFSNLGNAAVGAYYCTVWTNNVVQRKPRLPKSNTRVCPSIRQTSPIVPRR